MDPRKTMAESPDDPADPVTAAMQSAVLRGVFPGAVLCVRHRGTTRYARAFGLAVLTPKPQPASLDTVYDLASLTKPLATATALVCLLQDGRLTLADPLVTHLPELRGRPLSEVTVAHLLNHASGLPAWQPFYEEIAARDRTSPGFLGSPAARDLVLQRIAEAPLAAPPIRQAVYSDLGFILLGVIAERAAQAPLDRFLDARVYAPLTAAPLGFPGRDGAGTVRLAGLSVAQTEDDPWRGRVLCGEVHDENAYVIGGVAGHAGLFGTAAAVLALSGCWLNAVQGRESLLPPELARRFVSRQTLVPGSTWGLGWDTPSPPSSSGSRFSSGSFGHLGFTGTSLWVDVERELEVVLLSNRVHPTRRNDKIREFRPQIHDLVVKELMAGDKS